VQCCGPYRTHLRLHLPPVDHQPVKTIIISQTAGSPTYSVQLQ
jgi:hypothetical protein